MATIFIARDIATDKNLAAVREITDGLLLHDVNWNGGIIDVEVGDFTFVDCGDEIAGAALLARVQDALAEVL